MIIWVVGTIIGLLVAWFILWYLNSEKNFSLNKPRKNKKICPECNGTGMIPNILIPYFLSDQLCPNCEGVGFVE